MTSRPSSKLFDLSSMALCAIAVGTLMMAAFLSNNPFQFLWCVYVCVCVCVCACACVHARAFSLLLPMFLASPWTNGFFSDSKSY